jgi:hypothetical protein
MVRETSTAGGAAGWGFAGPAGFAVASGLPPPLPASLGGLVNALIADNRTYILLRPGPV